MWIGSLAHGTTVLTRMLRGSQKILVVLLLLLLLFLTIQENTRAQESLTAIQFPSHTHWGRFIVFPNILKYLKSQIVKKSELAQSCPTLCDPMDCSSPGSSVHGMLQARILEWVATSFHCCSVAQSCPTLCNSMDFSTPGFPVLHHLPEFA